MTTTGTGSWRRLRLGTRGSRLALTQSGQVAEALRERVIRTARGVGGQVGTVQEEALLETIARLDGVSFPSAGRLTALGERLAGRRQGRRIDQLEALVAKLAEHVRALRDAGQGPVNERPPHY